MIDTNICLSNSTIWKQFLHRKLSSEPFLSFLLRWWSNIYFPNRQNGKNNKLTNFFKHELPASILSPASAAPPACRPSLQLTPSHYCPKHLLPAAHFITTFHRDSSSRVTSRWDNAAAAAGVPPGVPTYPQSLPPALLRLSLLLSLGTRTSFITRRQTLITVIM